MKIKKAVIVAAGKSSRLYPRTTSCPKALLKIGNKHIIKYSIDTLKKMGVEEIGIVTGYMADLFPKELGSDYIYIYNPFFSHCNNLGSLWFAKDFIGSDEIIYLHCDLMYDPKILKNALKEYSASKNDLQLVVDFSETDEEAMKVIVDDNKMLIESNKEISLKKSNGEWTGIALIRNSKDVISYFEQDLKLNGLNNYDTNAFTKMAQDGYKISCCSTEQMNWVEIDFEDDFLRAQKLFS